MSPDYPDSAAEFSPLVLSGDNLAGVVHVVGPIAEGSIVLFDARAFIDETDDEEDENAIIERFMQHIEAACGHRKFLVVSTTQDAPIVGVFSQEHFRKLVADEIDRALGKPEESAGGA